MGGLTCFLLCKLLVGLTSIAERSDMIIAIWVDTVIARWVDIVITGWVDMIIAGFVSKNICALKKQKTNKQKTTLLQQT